MVQKQSFTFNHLPNININILDVTCTPLTTKRGRLRFLRLLPERSLFNSQPPANGSRGVADEAPESERPSAMAQNVVPAEAAAVAPDPLLPPPGSDIAPNYNADPGV